MGCLDWLLAPRCFAAERTDLAIVGISLWFVLSLWQGMQRTWRFCVSSAPPKARGIMWSRSHDCPGCRRIWQAWQAPLAPMNRASLCLCDQFRRLMAYIQIVIWALIFHLDLLTHHVVLVDLRLSFCWFCWLRPLWYPFSRVFDPPSTCELVFWSFFFALLLRG